jgi:hypothetical protein
MRKALVPAIAILLWLPVTAGAQQRQTFTGTFTAQAPGSPTAFIEAIDYANPDDPQGKPYSVHRVVLRMHPGTAVDTSVPEQCKATPDQFSQRGKDACPAESRVGGGEVDVDTGFEGGPFPRVIESDVTLFNDEGQLILFTESTNTSPKIRTSSRGPIDDATFTTEVPPLPGSPPPDSFTAIKRVRLQLDRIVSGGRAYITTPRTCDQTRRWTNTATFTYRDGATQTVESPTPCNPGTAPRDPGSAPRDRTKPRIRLGGGPRRGCAPRSFRLQVRIVEQSALRRAALYLDGRRLLNTERKRFSKRVRVASGTHRHRLVVSATDAAGNKTRRSVLFRRCC